MKKKTINKIIRGKIYDWLKTIDDESLKNTIMNNIIVTGGCITSMLLNEHVNDFDIYFKTKDAVKRVAQYYANKFNENNKGRTNKLGKSLHAWVLDGQDVETWKTGHKKLSEFAYDYPDISYENVRGWVHDEDNPLNDTYRNISGMILNTPPDRIKIMINSDGVAEDSDYIADSEEYDINAYLDALGDADEIPSDKLETKEKYKPIFLSTNAITLSNGIQLIARFYGKPSEIHKNFDFIHATNYWTYSTDVVLNKKALEAILNKELVYFGSKYPICSLIRTRKFIRRGWQINAAQYVKMAFQISELDLNNIYVLEDQLVGVDSIYFLAFINILRQKQMEDKDFVVTQDYVTSVIDKIFG